MTLRGGTDYAPTHLDPEFIKHIVRFLGSIGLKLLKFTLRLQHKVGLYKLWRRVTYQDKGESNENIGEVMSFWFNTHAADALEQQHAQVDQVEHVVQAQDGAKKR